MGKNNQNINIELKNKGSISVKKGTRIFDILKNYKCSLKYPALAARVNNTVRELSFEIEEDCSIIPIDITDVDGMRIYRRSLHLLLIKAAYDIFEKCDVRIHHSIGNGIYCTVKKENANCLINNNIKKIENRMREIASLRMPIEKHYLKRQEAEEIFKTMLRSDRYNIVKYRKKDYVSTYVLDGYEDYFYGYMVPDTGYLDKFSITGYKNGLVLVFPERNNPNVLPDFMPQQKLFDIFSEYENWGTILGAQNAGEINNMINDDSIDEFIRVSEALHEKKIAYIADMIKDSAPRKKIILISGPSSSGKTTFARRLSVQLKVNQLKPVTISLDDYYIDKARIPLDENGQPDLEALEALDLKLINEQLKMLLEGRTVIVPVFNFNTGKREKKGRELKLDDDTVLLIEGIHGLNPKLTYNIPDSDKFRIYISALTSLNIDNHNRIPTTDTRLIRRIVRDYQFRSTDAADTIRIWPYVRRGEQKNIFPYQECADIMFNSSLSYEHCALKKLAEPILEQISNNKAEYSEAARLREFLSCFNTIQLNKIPLNSILREFIGKSCFNRH